LRGFLSLGQREVLCAVLVLLYFVLTFTHELSPYLVAVQLGALSVARLIRPRWLPIALAAIALAYLLPKFHFVNSHYGLLSSIGDLFRNVAPPAASETLSSSQHLIVLCQLVLSLGMWLFALTGAWLGRRSMPGTRALFLLAFSPIITLVVLSYGNEGILRSYLFSLPWTAALASSAVLAPARSGLHRFRRMPLWNDHVASPLATFVKQLAPLRILLALTPGLLT
jgi:hypothetical protein